MSNNISNTTCAGYQLVSAGAFFGSSGACLANLGFSKSPTIYTLSCAISFVTAFFSLHYYNYLGEVCPTLSQQATNFQDRTVTIN